MKNLFKASVLAALISFGSANVFAADNTPTVSDAHKYIDELIGRNTVGSGSGMYSHYLGNGCQSSAIWQNVKYPDVRYKLEIDWSLISSVEADDFVQIRGRNSIRNTGEGTVPMSDYQNFDTWDSVTEKRLGNAMKLLMNSCAKKSKFD